MSVFFTGGSLQSDECHYWQGQCSNNLSYCVLSCSGPTVPFTVLVQYSDGVFEPGTNTHNFIKDIIIIVVVVVVVVVIIPFIAIVVYLETNAELQDVISDFDLPTIEEMEIPGDGG